MAEQLKADAGPRGEPPAGRSFAVAAALIAVSAATFLTWLIPLSSARRPWVFYFAAVLAAARVGGAAGGLIATGASAILGLALSLQESTTNGVLSAVVMKTGAFVLVAACMSVAVGALKAARDAQHDHQRWLEDILRSVREGVIGTDMNGVIRAFNGAASALTLVPAEQAVGKRLGEVLRVHDEDTGALLVDLPAEAENAQSRTARIDRPDGSAIPVEIRRSIVRAASAPTGVVITFRDLSDERAKLARLRASEEEFRAAFELAGVPKAQVDPETGRIVRANRQLSELTGYSQEELRRMTFADITHPDDRAADLAAFHSFVESGVSTHVVTKRYLRKDGGVRWVTVTATLIRDDQGKPLRTVAVIQDITGAHEAERALRELMQDFEGTFNQAAVGIAHMLSSGRFLRVNRKLCDIVGYSAEELTSLSFQQITHPDDLAADLERAEKLVRGDLPTYSLEKRYLRKDGSAVWINLTASAMRDSAGIIRYVIAVIEDIGARKIAESEIRRLNEVLERRVQERTAELEAFSYSVSHDLRAPLRSMQGFSQALREDYGAVIDAAGRDYINRIIASAKRMEALIDDLLDYSRVSRDELQLQPLSLTSMIADARAQLEEELEETQPDLRIEAPLPTVVGHRSTLARVIANLLSNAMKFVEKGRRPEIRIRAERRNGRVRLWIEDNGIGIRPEHHERIFGVFERLHAKDVYPGTGVGLAIVRRGIERMGGSSGVESASGDGSRFWIELDAAGDDDAA